MTRADRPPRRFDVRRETGRPAPEQAVGPKIRPIPAHREPDDRPR